MQDSERLLYLKQCLKGPPLDLVERVPINDYGYHFATRQLEARFYNPKRALFTLRQDLQDVRAPANTYNDLLRFQQDLLHICGNFLNAGEDINLNDFCFDIVMRKLPFTVRCTLSQRKRDQGDTSPWTISQLLEELQGALDVMSDAYLYEGPHQQPSGSRPRPSRPLALEHPYGSSYERTGGTFVGAIQGAPTSQSCAFCGAKGSHWASDCPKYVTISERYDRAMELDFCFSCLRNDHWRNNKECRVNRLCPFCKKCRHHQALCETFVTKRRAEGGQQQRRRKKKSSNRNQRGSRQTNDDWQGRPASGARQGGGDPVAPGNSAFHRTDGGPRQSRRPDEGRDRMHAAAAGNEEASLQTIERPPVYNENSGGAGPLRSLQQPSGSPATDSYAYDSVHLTQTNGQGFRPTKDDDTFSVVTHDSDAPTEPGMEQDFDSNGSSTYSGYAAVGATHAATERTHGTFLECAQATVFNPATKKRRTVCVFFDSGSSGTFVREEVALEMELPNYGSERLRMDTFAQDKPTRVDTFRTHIGFDQTDGSRLILDLKASSRLVPPLEAVFIKPSDEALLKQNRCDLVPQNVVPDILIGRDFRHLFVLEEVRPPLPNGFCLLRTTLGTVLAGSGQFKRRSSELTCSAKESSDSTSPPNSSFSSSEQTATAAQIGSHTTASEATPKAATAHKAVRFFDETTTGTTSETGIFKNARITHGSDAAATAHHVSYETHGHGSSNPPDENSNIGVPAESDRVSMFFSHHTEDESLHDMAQNFWKTENIGIEKNDPRKEDDVVHAHIRATICPSSDDEGRYQIRLPWKTSNGEPPSNQALPSHMGLARGRLGSFQRAHAHKPEFLRKYGE